MNILSEQQLKLKDSTLEILEFNGLAFINYPTVANGYILHFHNDGSILKWIETNYLFNLEYHWKKTIKGTLDELNNFIDDFKNIILSKKEELDSTVDQFAYINLFIIQNDNTYELNLTSDFFDLSKILKLKLFSQAKT